MLQKINHVKNIGRFYNVIIKGTPDSDPSFKKFNLIYADNGTGKSTFSTILKSLWENDPQRLIEKRTIGAVDESTVSLQVDGTTYTFQNKKWNKTPKITIEIFDEEFVAKNVFSPNSVEVENRRGLFNYIVLGEENVAMVEEVTRLNDLINGDLKTKIDNAEGKLKEAANIKDIKILDSALKLNDNTLKTMRHCISENTKKITHAERIINEKKLEKITDFEDIPYAKTISVDLGHLSLAAEYKAHVQTHNEWIKDGLEILKNGEKEFCPFCFLNIKDNKVIATYKTFFLSEYEALRNKVGNQISSVERIYSDAAIKNVVDLINRNSERCFFWHKLDETIPECLPLTISIEETTRIFKRTLKNMLERKKNNLLDANSPKDNESDGLKQEKEFRKAIAYYNQSIDELNENIQAVKKASQDIEELKVNNEKNHITVACNEVGYIDEDTSKLYKTLKQFRQEKKDSETLIKRLRTEIDQDSLKILEGYEESINRELNNFGVEFSIKGVKRKSDRSRTESVHFNICLKGESFTPNGSNDNPYKLSNTLSTGDKSTLAFAFFIAKYRKKDIRNQIFLFDDPITSLDFFRKIHTKNTILRFSKNAAQVIVLTHSIEFARLFKNEKKAIFVHINKNNSESGLSYIPYNKFDDMIIEKHSHNYKFILKYIADPSSVSRLEVMKSVRPYVETTISQFRQDLSLLSLGLMISRLKALGNICEDYIEDLEIINDIIVRESSHGGLNIDSDDYENITDDELMIACTKASQISAPPLIETMDEVPNR